jgi:hypothetical protein
MIWTRAGEDLCVAGGDGAATLAFERLDDH